MAGAVAGGIGVLGAVLKVGFGEVKDYQVGLADLDNVLKTTGNVAGVSSKGLEGLASSIQSYSGQTDDSIVKSEGLLLTFTNIHNAAGKNNDIFTQATKLTADMAAKFGGEASDSAIKLGKALNDPSKGLTALTKIGVSFTDGQKASIKAMQAHGDVAGAQKVILAELSKEVGGSAAAYGGTLAGQVDKAKRSFEDTSQSLVTALLPVLTSVMDFITTKLAPAFQSLTAFVVAHKAILGPLAAVLGTVAGVIWLVTTASKAWAVAQAALNIVMALNPIALVVIAIIALGAALVLAYKHSETFRTIVQAAFGAISAAASFMWNDVLKPTFRFLVDAFLLVAGTIVHGAASAFGWVPGVGGKLKSAAKAFDAFRDDVNNSLAGINDKTVAVHVVTSGVNGVNSAVGIASKQDRLALVGHNAQGTDSWSGGPSWVGENGPEILDLPRGSRVIPNHKLASIGGGGGGGTVINITVQGNVTSERNLLDAIRTGLLQQSRRTGGLGLA